VREEVNSNSTDECMIRLCTLPRKIAAISLEKTGDQSDGPERMGLILQLPADTDVEVCGAGFNSRTVKVRHNDSYYFVFTEDLPK
jgi:hypothetical protein